MQNCLVYFKKDNGIYLKITNLVYDGDNFHETFLIWKSGNWIMIVNSIFYQYLFIIEVKEVSEKYSNHLIDWLTYFKAYPRLIGLSYPFIRPSADHENSRSGWHILTKFCMKIISIGQLNWKMGKKDQWWSDPNGLS